MGGMNEWRFVGLQTGMERMAIGAIGKLFSKHMCQNILNRAD
jgi:hypothetical protein